MKRTPVFTADLCDHFPDKVQITESIFKRFGNKRSFNGPIHTLKVFEDNTLVKRALQTIPTGSVLVIDGGGSTQRALIGDNLAQIAVNRQLSGILVYGCIRDSAQINEMAIGILALGTTPMKSLKLGKGIENIPVHFAGALFEPGSYLYADEDGVIVSKKPLSLHTEETHS
ncbi:ribonuclease E activity regulator RraA [Halalkalibacter urbisdiaboli]|uniref:ribonuclease E activity regulator RraA n=1 Tax=Halalkalibacter urbisdiaboli TaxID=1960589 RepID=UPI000B43BF53|nr:ribonuclease E activity regulator RraA [Halalkalibacter urbisdiaboli]